MRLMSVDTLLEQHIDWLEYLQRKRREHVAKITALIATKQLEIDNLRARLGQE